MGRFDACRDVHFLLLLETALQGGVFDKWAFYRLKRMFIFKNGIGMAYS